MSTSNIPTDLKTRMKDSYDAIAVKYNKLFVKGHDPIRLDYLSRVLSLLSATDKDSASVLELGCGAGIPGTRILLENQTPQLHVTGNDLSSTQLDLARENLSSFSNERLKLVQGDMLALDFPDASLDAVFGFYSIIHLPRTEQTELMKKIAKWLKPGGLFLANFAVEEGENMVNETWMGEEKGWVYWSSWGEEGNVKMVEEAGLEVVVRENRQDIVDAKFVWIIGKK